jgi:hypothetical protein
MVCAPFDLLCLLDCYSTQWKKTQFLNILRSFRIFNQNLRIADSILNTFFKMGKSANLVKPDRRKPQTIKDFKMTTISNKQPVLKPAALSKKGLCYNKV